MAKKKLSGKKATSKSKGKKKKLSLIKMTGSALLKPISGLRGTTERGGMTD